MTGTLWISYGAEIGIGEASELCGPQNKHSQMMKRKSKYPLAENILNIKHTNEFEVDKTEVTLKIEKFLE